MLNINLLCDQIKQDCKFEISFIENTTNIKLGTQGFCPRIGVGARKGVREGARTDGDTPRGVGAERGAV